MTNVFDKAEAIQNYLRDNMVDPISRDGNWIHYDTIEDGLAEIEVGKTPAIYIERVTGQYGFLPTGTAINLDHVPINVHVLVRIKDCGRVNGIMIEVSKKLLDRIIEQVDEKLCSVDCRTKTGYIINRLTMGGVDRVKPDLKMTTWKYLIN